MDHHQCSSHDSMKSSCIAKVPIFNHLSDEEMKEVARVSSSKKYKKGELLYQAGETTNQLFIVHQGQVKIYRLTDQGKEQIIRFVKSGEFVGELSLFSNHVAASYAEALEDIEVCSIQQSDIHQLIIKYPTIALKILNVFSSRLHQTEEIIERLTSQEVETRIAAYLVEEAEKQYQDLNGNTILIRLPITKKDLSSFLGTSKETLSRRLATFQERGWIDLKGQREIIIKDFHHLKRMSLGSD